MRALSRELVVAAQPCPRCNRFLLRLGEDSRSGDDLRRRADIIRRLTFGTGVVCLHKVFLIDAAPLKLIGPQRAMRLFTETERLGSSVRCLRNQYLIGIGADHGRRHAFDRWINRPDVATISIGSV